MRIARRVVLVLVPALAATFVAAVALEPGLRERLSGDTVEARIAAFMDTVMRGDRERALAAWRLDPRRPNNDEIAARRDVVTVALADLGVRRYAIERTDWWRTCCEPGQIDDPRNAGLARVIVRLDTDTGSHRYVFDVLARETAYWGDAAGYPAHDWTLRDVYRVGDPPRFARFADVSAMHPDVIAAVRRYYGRYAEAFVACDIRLLWEEYPALAQGTDLGAGINSEGTHVSGMCGARPVTARFDLEWGGPLRLHLHGEGVDVTVHGLEEFDLTPGRSAGEF